MTNGPALYGLLAGFDDPGRLVPAIRQARDARYTRLEAFAPLPVVGLSDALGLGRTWLPTIAVVAGLGGTAAGYLLPYYTNAIDYPLNVGGRPLHSWPAYVILAALGGLLAAALAVAVAMIVLNGLPRLHHPVFNLPAFTDASHTRFFLCVRADDPRFESDSVRTFLTSLDPVGIWEVPQ
jgi:hypothetical protein